MNETAKKLFSKGGIPPTELEKDSYDGISSLLVKGFTPEFQVVHLSQRNLPVIMTFKDVQNELSGETHGIHCPRTPAGSDQTSERTP